MYISLALVVLFIPTCIAQSYFDKILLQNVDAIVLRQGQMTNARRVSPIPQLSCVAGPACCSSTTTPNSVICSNVGSQGGDVRWECEADFDEWHKFGRIQVFCEGYEHSADPYILKDSCGLEYEIDIIHAQSSWFSFTNILLTVLIGLLLYALYKDCLKVDTTAPPPIMASPDTVQSWFDSYMMAIMTAIFITFKPTIEPIFKRIVEDIFDAVFKGILEIFVTPFRLTSNNVSCTHVPTRTLNVGRRPAVSWPQFGRGGVKNCFLF